MTERDDLAVKVAAARKEIGWTQAQLAKHIGVSQPTIFRVENGAQRMKVVTLALESFVADVKAGTLFAS